MCVCVFGECWMSEAGPVSALQMYGESNQEDIRRANAENIRAGEYSMSLDLLPNTGQQGFLFLG